MGVACQDFLLVLNEYNRQKRLEPTSDDARSPTDSHGRSVLQQAGLPGAPREREWFVKTYPLLFDETCGLSHAYPTFGSIGPLNPVAGGARLPATGFGMPYWG